MSRQSNNRAHHRARQRPRRCQRSRQAAEQGAAAVWTLLIAGGVFLPLVGVSYDIGNAQTQQIEARRVAEQAARAGADELSGAGLRSGTDVVNADAAASRARTVMTAAGWSGSVQIAGSKVTVTVRGNSDNKFLGGIKDSFAITASGSANSIRGPQTEVQP